MYFLFRVHAIQRCGLIQEETKAIND